MSKGGGLEQQAAIRRRRDEDREITCNVVNRTVKSMRRIITVELKIIWYTKGHSKKVIYACIMCYLNTLVNGKCKIVMNLITILISLKVQRVSQTLQAKMYHGTHMEHGALGLLLQCSPSQCS